MFSWKGNLIIFLSIVLLSACSVNKEQPTAPNNTQPAQYGPDHFATVGEQRMTALEYAQYNSVEDLEALANVSNLPYRLREALTSEELSMLSPEKRELIQAAEYRQTPELPPGRNILIFDREGNEIDLMDFLNDLDPGAIATLSDGLKEDMRNLPVEVLQTLSTEKLNALMEGR